METLALHGWTRHENYDLHVYADDIVLRGQTSLLPVMLEHLAAALFYSKSGWIHIVWIIIAALRKVPADISHEDMESEAAAGRLDSSCCSCLSGQLETAVSA